MIGRKPRVSVVIPTYNRAGLLGRAVRSVLNQSFEDFEILVVDDASTDGTDEVISSLNDERVKYFYHGENMGISAARNTGIRNARGKYIGFLDSDDEWLPSKLEKQISCFEGSSGSVGAVYCRHYLQDELFGNYRGVVHLDPRKGEVYREIVSGWFPGPPSLFLLTREALEESGLFDEDLPCFEDVDLYIRIAERFSFDYVDEPLVVKHQHFGYQFVMDYDLVARGSKLLLDKWGEQIKEDLGEVVYRKFRSNQLAMFHRNKMIASSRREILYRLMKIKNLTGISKGVLANALVVLIGGERLFTFANRIRLLFFK